jgi:hypothetical protein
MINRFLCFFALYFGVCFASPLLITLANNEDIAFTPLSLSVAALALVIILSAGSYLLAARSAYSGKIAALSLACAFVFAIQGNVIHDLFYYGDFNGSRVDWRHFGWKFWVEFFGYLLAFPLFYWILTRLRQIPAWLALVPVLSSVLLVAPALLDQGANVAMGLADDDVNPEVFEFSSSRNLIHLLPDGFQGDIVREVLEDHPDLAGRLDGFTLYSNHLGMYQGTAPSIPTIFMGRPFDFEAGHDWVRIMDELKVYSYPAHLLANGYRLDYVSLSSPYCIEGSASCIIRPFNDMKPRGYHRYKDERHSYAIRLLADLSLFRHLPMFFKEWIYNDGNWFFADTTLDGSSPWPDPVLREWVENMTVAGPEPRYKWYHYIGTHIPPHWDANCKYGRDLERNREQYYGQAVCVIKGIAAFADKLRELEIYDQSAIIISGDHGINIEPDDRLGMSANGGLYPGLMGASRPALLVKSLDSRAAFKVSDSPTSLLDIAPTALDLVGIDADFPGESVFSIDPDSKRDRYFTPFTTAEFWTGESISYDTWRVSGPVKELKNWSLQSLFHKELAPVSYPAINYSTAFATSRGLSVSRAKPNEESAWIGGSEFSILVGIEQPALPAKIELEMLLPDFLEADNQSFTVSINDTRVEGVYTLEKGKDWVPLEISVPEGLLQSGNNLVTLKFSETGTQKNRKYWQAAGKLKSFNLVQ